MFIRRVYTSPRVDRYARLLTELDSGAGLDASAFELGEDEVVETAALLNGDIYLANSRVRRYVLLRLEELISAAGNPIFQPKTITIEHVLPQHPAWTRPGGRSSLTASVHCGPTAWPTWSC